MRLDDRTADRQSHAHAIRLGRVECVEESVQALRLQSRAPILHGDAHAVCSICLGADQQLPRPLVRSAHRFDGVEDQVEHHLLKLDPISRNERQAFRQLCLQQSPGSAQFAARQCDDFADHLVDVQQVLARRGLSDERTHPADDVAGSSPGPDDPIESLSNLLRIGWLHIEPAQSGLRIGDHRGDRLIDLMGDRGRQLPHGHDAVGVRERLSFFLRPPAFGHIHHRPHEFD